MFRHLGEYIKELNERMAAARREPVEAAINAEDLHFHSPVGPSGPFTPFVRTYCVTSDCKATPNGLIAKFDARSR